MEKIPAEPETSDQTENRVENDDSLHTCDLPFEQIVSTVKVKMEVFPAEHDASDQTGKRVEINDSFCTRDSPIKSTVSTCSVKSKKIPSEQKDGDHGKSKREKKNTNVNDDVGFGFGFRSAVIFCSICGQHLTGDDPCECSCSLDEAFKQADDIDQIQTKHNELSCTSSYLHIQNHNQKKCDNFTVCKPCDQTSCDKNLVGCIPDEMISHMTTHTRDKPFKCEICNKSFVLKTLLTDHMITHTEGRPYKCAFCDMSFVNRMSWERHMKSHAEGHYVCPLCNESFGLWDKSTLADHMMRHSEEINTSQDVPLEAKTDKKVCKCVLCDKAFVQESFLIEHLKKHVKRKRSFKCRLCGKPFVCLDELTDHMRTHAAGQCALCHKSFRLISQLTIHMKINHMTKPTGDKPFKCSIFNKSCVGKASLTDHTCDIPIESNVSSVTVKMEGSPTELDASGQIKRRVENGDSLHTRDLLIESAVSAVSLKSEESPSEQKCGDIYQSPNIYIDEYNVYIEREASYPQFVIDNNKYNSSNIETSVEREPTNISCTTPEQSLIRDYVQPTLDNDVTSKRNKENTNANVEVVLDLGFENPDEEHIIACSICGQHLTGDDPCACSGSSDETLKKEDDTEQIQTQHEEFKRNCTISSCYSHNLKNCDNFVVCKPDDHIPCDKNFVGGIPDDEASGDKSFRPGNELTAYNRIDKEKRLHRYTLDDKSLYPSDLTHMRTHTREKRFKCTICNKSFTQKVNLFDHLNIHTGERPYQCTLCTKSFSRRYSLFFHMKMHAGVKPYKCSICTRSYLLKRSLTDHMITHTGERPYKCVLCHKSYMRKAPLTDHMAKHTGERPYKCGICHRSFVRKCLLTDHLTMHTGEKPYKCNICHKSYVRKGILSDHMTTHTGDRPYKCTFCDLSFGKRWSWNKHRRRHVENGLYKCPLCNESFVLKGKNILTDHMRRHTEEGSAGLDVSLRTHTDKNECRCPLCDQSFAQESYLIEHIRTHVMRRRGFKCKLCGNTSLSPVELLYHMRSHAAGGHYKCALCDKSFGLTSQLTLHMMTHRGDRS